MDKNQNGHSIPTPTSPRKPIFPTLLVIILSILAVAVITGIIIALVLRPSDNTDNTSSPDEQFSSETDQLLYDATKNGSIEDVVNTCTERANLVSAIEQKADVYLQCAYQLAISYGDKAASQILGYAHAAEDVSPSVSSARAISNYESRYGDSEIALQYNKIALERLESEPNYKADQIKYLEAGGGR